MKSKKLFFDTTILKRNFKQYWPVWGGYLFIMLWALPAVLSINYSLSTGTLLEARRLEMTEYILDFAPSTGGLALSCIIGLIAGMNMFSYLHKERSCYFYHSLPVTRERLFTTNFLSGLLMMIVPNLIAVLLAMVATASKGYACIKESLQLFVLLSAIELFFYSYAVICMIITGQKITSFVLYIIFLFYVPGMLHLMNDMIGQMFFGVVKGNLAIPGGVLEILSPVRFCYGIRVETIWDEVSYRTLGYSIGQEAWLRVLELFIVSLIIIALAVLLYRIRKSETAGDLICYKYAKPVFAWGVGISFGIVITDFLLNSLFSSFSRRTSMKFIAAFCLVITCLIGYMIAQMLLNKTFRIFNTEKKNMLIFGGVIIVFSVIFVLDITDVVGYVPNVKDIKSVDINTPNGYLSNYSEDGTGNIEEITALHKAILAERDNVYDGNNMHWGDSNLQYVHINYYTNNGLNISRTYYVPESNQNVSSKLTSFEYNHRIDYLFNGIKSIRVSKAIYTYMDMNGYFIEKEVYGSEARGLFEAVKADVLNDNLSVPYARGEKTYYYNDTDSFSDKYVENFYREYEYYSVDPYTNDIEKNIGYDHPLHIEFGTEDQNNYYNRIEIYYNYDCPQIIYFIDKLNADDQILGSITE